MSETVKYVGLDVHKITIAVAVAEDGKRAEVREHGEIAAMGARGRGFVEREFSWEGIALRMIAAYRHVARGEPKPGFVHRD